MNVSVVVSLLLIPLILFTLLGFAFRVVGAVFSPKSRKKIRAHPVLHFLRFILCLAIGLLVISPVFFSQPPEDVAMEDHFHKHELALTNLFHFKGSNPAARFVKGYVYSASEPGPIKDNLDTGHNDLAPYARFYRRIQGDWYMYMENQRD